MEQEPQSITKKQRIRRTPKAELSEDDRKNIALINDLKRSKKLEDARLVKDIQERDYDYICRGIVRALMEETEKKQKDSSSSSSSEEEIVVVKKKRGGDKTRVEPKPVYNKPPVEETPSEPTPPPRYTANAQRYNKFSKLK